MKLLENVDIFGQNFKLNLKGNNKNGTRFGGLMTILLYLICLFYFCALLTKYI